MPDPINLPLELYDMVIGYASNHNGDYKLLCNISLISRYWYDTLNARIYSKHSYDGELHSISSLWKFLRTILCSKGIGNSVHALNIRNWTFGLVHGHSKLTFSKEDLELIQDAIHKAGLEYMETSLMEAIRKTDPRPLMALLLASLPNLTTLYAHLPETDIFFSGVLQKAIESQRDEFRPLKKLSEAHFTSSWNYRQDWRSRDHYDLWLGHLWPVFQLQSLQSLSMFDIRPLGAGIRFGSTVDISCITDLSLVYHDSALLAHAEIVALLSLPKALTKFSIYMNDSGGFIEKCRQLSNASLWKALCKHQDSIKHLDIYRDCTGCLPPVHSANNSHFESMQGFKQLEYLSIQPEVLIGGCCGDDIASFRLRDTLPSSLKSFTVYGEEGLATNKTIGQQLQDLVASTEFPRLKHIVLEEKCQHLYHYVDPVEPPHEKVEIACKEHGITFETKRDYSLSKGGFGGRYYSSEQKSRLRMAKKLETVRYALTEHLSRLRQVASAGARSAISRLELSSDDLDTYELLWDELTEEALYGKNKYTSQLDFDDTDDTDSQEIESQELSSENSETGDEESDLESDGMW
jgi:hypothetical protein